MIEILYVAWNRLEFTGLSWELMIRNTNWDLVSKLTVYDDGSTDGTLEFLRDHLDECPVERELRISDLRSPVAVMNHFLATERDELFAKVDNDILLPPHWLSNLARVMRDNPEVELLGCESGQTQPPPRRSPRGGIKYGFEPSSHIGGIGLMRTSAFTTRPALAVRGRFGFTEWQNRYLPVRGWVTPDLLVPQLDRVPVEPWASLSQSYVDAGWQRDWPTMLRPWADIYWDWAIDGTEEE